MMFASAFCLAVFFFDAFLSFSSDYMWSLSDQIETCFLMLLDHLDIFGSFGIIWKRNMTRNSEHLPQALDIVSNIAMVCDITINATSMINQMKPPMFVVPSANQNCVYEWTSPTPSNLPSHHPIRSTDFHDFSMNSIEISSFSCSTSLFFLFFSNFYPFLPFQNGHLHVFPEITGPRWTWKPPCASAHLQAGSPDFSARNLKGF